MSIWAVMTDADCGADDPIIAHLRVPAVGMGTPFRHVVTSWTRCHPSGDCTSACAVRAADGPDWLLSSFINGIKRMPCDFGWP